MFQREAAFPATKPKSAIDDLFADADSEEDSDDIFSSKNVVKKRAKEPAAGGDAFQANAENAKNSKTFLDVIAPGVGGCNIATSTPESHVNVTNLFSDEENDDGDLFGASKKQQRKPASATNASASAASATQESSKKVSCRYNFMYVQLYFL